VPDRGSAFMLASEYQKAMDVFDNVLAEQPGNTATLVERALAHLSLGHYAKARADCDAVLASEPNNPRAYGLRSFARYMQFDIVGAIQDGTASVGLDEKCTF